MHMGMNKATYFFLPPFNNLNFTATLGAVAAKPLCSTITISSIYNDENVITARGSIGDDRDMLEFAHFGWRLKIDEDEVKFVYLKMIQILLCLLFCKYKWA